MLVVRRPISEKTYRKILRQFPFRIQHQLQEEQLFTNSIHPGVPGEEGVLLVQHLQVVLEVLQAVLAGEEEVLLLLRGEGHRETVGRGYMVVGEVDGG